MRNRFAHSLLLGAFGSHWLGAISSLLLGAIGCGAIGCGASEANQPKGFAYDKPAGLANASSGSEAERYFPLVDGNLYQYETVVYSDAASAPTGLLMVRASRTSTDAGELRMPSGAKKFRYQTDGISTITKTGDIAYVLRLPLAAGATWLGERGGQTRIDATALNWTGPSGTYQGCVRTAEERRGDQPISVKTTFCPDVGIVELEAASGANVEKAKLIHYGKPVDIGPEGVTRVPN
jgi:hypothetical protein